MNTCRTDHGAVYEHAMPRERYRKLLIASQLPKEPHHYNFHGEPATLWECLGLTLFALIMIGGLAEAIMWGMR